MADLIHQQVRIKDMVNANPTIRLALKSKIFGILS